MRKIFLGVVFVVLLVVVSVAPAFAQDTIEMQVAWWGSQNRADRTLQVIELFKESNPGVEIVSEFAAFADYWTLMGTKAAGQQLPCVMQQDYAYLREWQTRGLLAPLDGHIESGVIDTTNIAPSLLEGGKVGDEIYAISLGTNSESFILDLDAFERAGMDLPPPQWTWAEFEAIAVELHEKLGVWAIDLAIATDAQVWKGVNLGNGYSVASEDGTQLGYDDDQPTIDHYNMIRRLQEAGVLASGEENAEFTGIPLESSPIVTGDTAMQYQWSNQVVAVFSGAGPERRFKLWHLPRPEGGQPSNYLKPSQYFSITSSCETPELAAAFIDMFTNDLVANEALLAERGVPISSAVRDHLLPLLDAAGTESFDYVGRVTEDASPIPPPDPPNWSNFTGNVFGPLFAQPLVYGQISVEDAVVVLREEGNAVLGEGA